MFRGALVGAGVLVFVCASLVPTLGPSVGSDARPLSVAQPFPTATPEEPGRAPERVRDVARAEILLGVQSTPAVAVEPAPVTTPDPTPEPSPEPTPAPVVPTLRAVPDPPTAGIVIASWYGPGFYGNRTACGQVYTPEIIGVAHRTLPCGTLLVIEFRGRSMTVPVIDRGPYIAGRTLDLSNATKIAMACTDLCTVSMRIVP